MFNLLKELEKNKIFFPVEYFGLNDFGTFWDIKTVLENKEVFQNYLASKSLQNIESINDYLDYLYLKKLAAFHGMIFTIRNEEDQQIVKDISCAAKLQLENIKNGDIIRFINKSYREIFKEENHIHLLPQITLDLMVPFQSGISNEVFDYLAKNYNYLLLERYNNFQKRFEKDSSLFNLLFHKKNLEEMRELRLDCVFPIFIVIWRSNNESLKKIITPIIENVIADTESLIKKDTSVDSRDILVTNQIFRQVYDLIKQIEHPKVNMFKAHYNLLEQRLHDHLKSHGQVFSYEIPTEEILKRLKKCPNWQVQMLSLTHTISKEESTLNCVSRLAFSSKGKQNLIDLVSSNIPGDDYFTYSHQNWLRINMSVGAATIHAIWHDQELYPNFIQWYISFLSFISEQVGCTENLEEDIQILTAMLQPVVLSDDKDKVVLKPLCYGAGIFICAMMEKVLRSFYIYLLENKIYVPLTSVTLGSLLSCQNQEMVDVFGEDHLKNISYFINTVGDKKVGWNIRNSLAHWVGMNATNLNSTLVAQLFYLYTDIVNTLFWYLYTRDIDV